ncbi:MAG: diadenylate cyclase CdaA [Bacteroidota bacterium]
MIYLFNIGFLEIRWVDFIDVLLVSILIYQVYKLMRGSVAIKVFLGFLSLYLIFLVVRAAHMELLTIILGQFMGVGIIALIILFQQEIRKFLLLLGKTTVFEEGRVIEGVKRLWRQNKGLNVLSEVTPVVEAAKTLGGTNTGALIVYSRNSALKFYAESGDYLEAIISKRLLLSIFNKYSPLHDGAVIIHQGRVVAARCILPVTDRDDIPARYGLRHRAAVGMSEATDTLVIVVSEETGQFSAMRNGKVSNNLSAQELRKRINEYLKEKDSPAKKETPPKKDAPASEKTGTRIPT